MLRTAWFSLGKTAPQPCPPSPQSIGTNQDAPHLAEHFGDTLAIVHHLQSREFLCLCLKQVGQPVQ